MRELCLEHTDKESELCLNYASAGDVPRELCLNYASVADVPRVLCVKVTDVDVPALTGIFDATFDATFG